MPLPEGPHDDARLREWCETDCELPPDEEAYGTKVRFCLLDTSMPVWGPGYCTAVRTALPAVFELRGPLSQSPADPETDWHRERQRNWTSRT